MGHSLEEKNKMFEAGDTHFSEKTDLLKQNISDLKNTIIVKEDENTIQKRKFNELEFSINTLEEQNKTLEKNEIGLNETIDLLKQNINDQLNKHNIELSNRSDELIKTT